MLDVESRAAGAADVILKDGGTLRLRPPAADDADALLAFFRGLSEHSLYQRFHGIRTSTGSWSSRCSTPTGSRAAHSSGGYGDRVVARRGLRAPARPRRPRSHSRSPTRSKGAGSARACSSSWPIAPQAPASTRFVAEVLAENRAMLSVFTGAGFEVVRELEHGEVEVSFPIAATETFQARVEERDHIAVAASLRPFFEPRTVAVIGASRRRGLDRRRALPQRARGRLRRRGVPGQPGRRAGRGSARRTTRSRRSPTRSSWRSSACPGLGCSRRPTRRCARACARSA